MFAFFIVTAFDLHLVNRIRVLSFVLNFVFCLVCFTQVRISSIYSSCNVGICILLLLLLLQLFQHTLYASIVRRFGTLRVLILFYCRIRRTRFSLSSFLQLSVFFSLSSEVIYLPRQSRTVLLLVERTTFLGLQICLFPTVDCN